MRYCIILDEKPELIEHHLNLGGRNELEEIEVNSRYFIKNGKPWIPIMGEVHYSRLDEEHWERELLKMKAGGIRVISCYVIWIYHEETEGLFDFTGNRNLKRFLELAVQCDLKVVLRIGPWVHGEVRNGGFPDWLLQKGCQLRQDDPVYLSYVKRFFQEIKKQADAYLFHQNGPIWAIQLENELTDQAQHLLTLRHIAEEIGLTAPIYTVTGWNSLYGAEIPEHDVIPVFGGYPEAPWECHKNPLEPNSNYFFLPARNDSSIGNDLMVQTANNVDGYQMKYEWYPFATCELGGGMQVTHHRRPVMGRDEAAALALVKLGCGNNMPGYYMYHGGTNEIVKTTLQESKNTGYPNDYPIRSYDFQAPIGEYGQIRGAYRQLKQQHYFIETYMKQLAPMDAYFQEDPITDKWDCSKLRYSIRTDHKSGFVFVNQYQRLLPLPPVESVQFEVPCEDGTLLFPEQGMTIPDGAYCILPYYMDLNGILLEYATAQPLYHSEDTWFFFTPFGIKPEYSIIIAGETKRIYPQAGTQHVIEITGMDESVVKIVTLTQKEAEQFYILGDKVAVTEGAELYQKGQTIYSYRTEDPNLSYSIWNGNQFVRNEITGSSKEIPIKYQEFVPNIQEYPHAEELFLDGKKNICAYRMSISKEWLEGLADRYLRITYTGDVLQIYADGILAADDFNKGIPYEVSVAALLKYGTKLELLISEQLEGSAYMEAGEGHGLALKNIIGIPCYQKI